MCFSCASIGVRVLCALAVCIYWSKGIVCFSVEAPIITTFCLYWSYLTHASYYPLSNCNKVKYYVSSIYAIKIVNQIAMKIFFKKLIQNRKVEKVIMDAKEHIITT